MQQGWASLVDSLVSQVFSTGLRVSQESASDGKEVLTESARAKALEKGLWASVSAVLGSSIPTGKAKLDPCPRPPTEAPHHHTTLPSKTVEANRRPLLPNNNIHVDFYWMPGTHA